MASWKDRKAGGHTHGADLCVRDSEPLFNAAMASDAAGVRFLLSFGANANARMGIGVKTAICNGHTEIVELLLAAGGKLATPDWVVHSADLWRWDKLTRLC
jgi:hypothetical protein